MGSIWTLWFDLLLYGWFSVATGLVNYFRALHEMKSDDPVAGTTDIILILPAVRACPSATDDTLPE